MSGEGEVKESNRGMVVGGGYISSGKSAKSTQGIGKLYLDSGLYIKPKLLFSISAKEPKVIFIKSENLGLFIS